MLNLISCAFVVCARRSLSIQTDLGFKLIFHLRVFNLNIFELKLKKKKISKGYSLNYFILHIALVL